MYVTRRLLRSTLEESTAVKHEPIDASEEVPVFSPRKRRPRLQTQAELKDQHPTSTKSNNGTNANKSKHRQSENQGDNHNRSDIGDAAALRGMGLLIDARDSKERWCEAKILNLNLANKSVYIHYVGWNTRYDCWLEAKYVAAHGSHTKVKPKAGTSWNGKESLFSDPTIPDKPTKTSVTVNAKKATPTKSKNKKRLSNSDSNTEMIANTSANTFKRASNRATVRIKVNVDAVDEESELKTRRGSRREKIDLELELDVQGDDREDAKPPTKRTRASPTAKASKPPPIKTVITSKPPPSKSAESPTLATQKKFSPHPNQTVGVESETMMDAEEKALVKAPLQSPTVGMSMFRRSARAARTTTSKKRKEGEEEDDDSDEEYKEEEDEEDDDEEEEEEEEEGSESDNDLSVRRSSVSNGKARRASSSSSSAGAWRTGDAVITQWQTDPAYGATRDRLSSIFRHRLQQRGDFDGSFQQAMSSSSAASTPRTPREDSSKEKNKRGPKKKKAKSAHSVMDDDEKAAAAQYYYTQHYYHMQAYQYQYHQHMYQQALMVQQLEQQRPAAESENKSGRANGGEEEEDTVEKEVEEEEEDDDDTEEKPSVLAEETTDDQAPMMNGGIIDPRIIHARMDALEHQKRMQLYYQHYAQATERNLQMLAATPEFLNTGANLWREQMQHVGELPREEADDASPLQPTAERTDVEMEEKPPVAEAVGDEKLDETRCVENSGENVGTESPIRTTTPEETLKAIEKAMLVTTKASGSPSSPESQEEEPATETANSPSAVNAATSAKTEAVLFELVL